MPFRNRTVLRDSRRIYWVLWRGLILAIVLSSAMIAFALGAATSERLGLAEDGLLTQLYDSIGLFVLGGMDLGRPVGGSPFARGLLWFAYFAAPLVTASAVIEGVLRAVDPNGWRMRRLSGHIVIGGCGRLAMLYLARLRKTHPLLPVVVVEERSDHPNAITAREIYRARIVTGDISNPAVLRTLGLNRARRVLLVTGRDTSNLDAAARIIAESPGASARTVVHVSDLAFKRQMAQTRVAKECEMFNIYQLAACHLVETELKPHFEATEARDVLVLGGFGRLGQTVLDELQRTVPDALGQVIIVDTEGEEKAAVFDEQVGFSTAYKHETVTGSIDHVRLWQDIERRFDLASKSPVFILSAGDDAINLRVALRLSRRYPAALTVARTYFRSSFAEDLSRDANFHMFSVADLVTDSLPDGWLR